jgi:cell pole-organizing protein PopZ
MRRYLVVANQTLGGEHLAEKVRACLAAGPSRFHILVPATQPHEHAVWTEGEARAVASQRLEQALERFRELGAEAQGDVGDERPLQAIADAVRDQEFDEIILSTLPPGLSRWLRQDLPHRVERTFEGTVTHVVAEPESSGAERTG